jgi:hypothetical protein
MGWITGIPSTRPRTSRFGLHPDSNTAIAASEPEPIVTYGNLSVDPCGWMVNKWAPVASTPPSTSAAPMWPWCLRQSPPMHHQRMHLQIHQGTHWKSRCLSIVIAVTTRGLRPVESACNSILLEMSAVTNSVSAAVPAPQHLMDSLI